MPHHCNENCFETILENRWNIWNWFVSEDYRGEIYNFYVITKNAKGWVRAVCICKENVETGVITHMMPEDSKIYTGRLFYRDIYNGKQLRIYDGDMVLECV
jgi:hypothetical protein